MKKEGRNGVLRGFQQLRSYLDETETEPGINFLHLMNSFKGSIIRLFEQES